MAHTDPIPITRLRGLLEATRLIREEPDPTRLFDAIARTVSQSLGYRSVVMNTYRPAWDDFEVTTVVGSDEARELLLGDRLPWAEWMPLLDSRFERSGAYLIPEGEFDWEQSPGRTYVPSATGAAGSWRAGDALFAPMMHSRGHFLGIISVDEPVSGQRPDDVAMQVLAAVAEHAAMALEATHDRAAAERQQAALGQLMQVSSQMTETLSADAVLDSICHGICEALGYAKVALEIPDPQTGVLHLHASVGWNEDELDAVGPDTMRDLTPLLDPDFEIEGCYVLTHAEALARLPAGTNVYRSVQNGAGPWAWDGHWLMVPLWDSEGNLGGMIWVDEPIDRLLPERPMLQTLRVFANQATAALNSAARFEEMRFLAEHDPLTRLLNRRAFNHRLKLAIERSRRYRQRFALVLCDLDDLKATNDRDGHEVGDAALTRVARQLAGSVRASDTVFRIGGDEFALILPESNPATVETVMHRIAAGLGPSDDGLPALRVSMGASIYPDDDTRVDGLFQAADRAMYAHKRDGRRGPRRAA